MGQYSGKGPIGLIYVRKPLITAITAIKPLLTRKNIRISILCSVAIEGSTLESDRVILLFGQTGKLVFHICVARFGVKLAKFPDAKAQVFSFDFRDTTRDRLKNSIMYEDILSLN